jgi:hypothetical protein
VDLEDFRLPRVYSYLREKGHEALAEGVKLLPHRGLHLRNGDQDRGERLTPAEMQPILEEIARDSGNSAARIAALRQLRRVGAAV